MLTTFILLWCCSLAVDGRGILYPYGSESRDVKFLDGVWQFRLEDTPGIGNRDKWYSQKMTLGGPTLSMPVPSSYNDVTVNANIRDHVGVVWYDRNFYVPKFWQGLRVWLRFASVYYLAHVWVNGEYITSHEFGAVPFQAEVTSVLKYGAENLVTVSVNNTLTDFTIPSGELEEIDTLLASGASFFQCTAGLQTAFSRSDNTDSELKEAPRKRKSKGQQLNSIQQRGKSPDLPVLFRDLYLTSWLGINIYRSVNRLLNEIIMDAIDEGLAIIDECPFITGSLNADLLEKHKQYFTELIRRDKNRPSVIMWSLGNRLLAVENDDSYYRSVVAHVKSLDGIRPITAPLTDVNFQTGNVAQYLDIIGVAGYIGWYSYRGELDAIVPAALKVLHGWQKYGKPVFMMEYGAEEMPGVHTLPEWPWSEEYQIKFLSKHFEVFDAMRNQSEGFIGEVVWTYTDFKTKVNAIDEVEFDRKGIFTRQREPKDGASIVRRRYHLLAYEIDGQPLPQSLYVAPAE